MLSRFESRESQLKVSVYRCCNYNGVDAAISQKFSKFICNYHPWMTALSHRKPGLILITDRHNLCTLGISKVPHKIWAPVAVPNNTNSDRTIPHWQPTLLIIIHQRALGACCS